MAPKPTSVDFNKLWWEVTEFLENANDGLYFRPNREIPKTKRSKWRFEFRRFIKDLVAVRREFGGRR
ncbi:MAG: hypothetical protein LBG11_09605 [Bifidobacteriaceae bacterium]|nr:hypothetical protein [Bifidobacteriaceae bacterium]